MRPTNYSHEQQPLSDVAQMQERLRSFNVAADGAQRSLIIEFPDLHLQDAARIQAASPAGIQPTRPKTMPQYQVERDNTISAAEPVVSAPPIDQPRTATAGNLINFTEREQQRAEQLAMLAAARQTVDQEAK